MAFGVFTELCNHQPPPHSGTFLITPKRNFVSFNHHFLTPTPQLCAQRESSVAITRSYIV